MRNCDDPLARTKKVVALVHACSVSINQAIAVALVRIGGTVVDVKLKGKPEKVHWRIKVLTAEGPVKVYIDGRSGEILEAWSEGSLPLPDDRVVPKDVMVGHTNKLESAPR
jgi:peptidase YpeB-like protein